MQHDPKLPSCWAIWPEVARHVSVGRYEQGMSRDESGGLLRSTPKAVASQKNQSPKSHEDRLFLTPSIKPIVEELQGEGRQQCSFSIRYEVDVVWEGPSTSPPQKKRQERDESRSKTSQDAPREGDEKLVLSALEPGLFFSKHVASCDLPLALCYEQLVSAAKNCNPTEVSGWFAKCLEETSTT